MSEQDLREQGGEEDRARIPDDEDERDIEAPEADAAEQHTEVVDTEDRHAPSTSDEVDPADRADQERVVDLGEDEYR